MHAGLQTIEASLNMCCGNLAGLQSQFQEAGILLLCLAHVMLRLCTALSSCQDRQAANELPVRSHILAGATYTCHVCCECRGRVSRSYGPALSAILAAVQ